MKKRIFSFGKHYCVLVLVLSFIHQKKQLKIERYHHLNQESKTFLNISSNEGRECGSSETHVSTRLKYDCGHSDWIDGRSPFFVIDENNSAGLVTFTS